MICTFSRAALAALLCLALASPASAAETPAYNFAPVNQTKLQLTASIWQPILHYVSQRSGVTLHLKLGRTADDTTALTVNGEADFAYTNHLFSPERIQLGWKVFGRRQGGPVQAQIIVPANSSIHSLSELANSTVVFSSQEAVLGHTMPHAELLRNKLAVQPEYAGNMDAAFAQLQSGRAHAAGAHSRLVEAYTHRRGNTYRVLWQSEPVSDLALMASRQVPPEHIRKVALAFFGMQQDPAGRRILDAANALMQSSTPLGFVAASDADYVAYRDFYHTAAAMLP